MRQQKQKRLPASTAEDAIRHVLSTLFLLLWQMHMTEEMHRLWQILKLCSAWSAAAVHMYVLREDLWDSQTSSERLL